MKPGELEPLMREGGFERQALLGREGLVSFIEEEVNGLWDEPWQAWVEVNYQASSHDPALLGESEHILYVGSKVP